MIREHLIRLVNGSEEEPAVVVCEKRDDDCHIVLRYRGKSVEASASDYFEAFCRVRRMLEKDGLKPLCYGASLNVYPSGMCRDMGSGLKAYRLTIGKHAEGKELVDIFASGQDVNPATVAEQEKFFKAWPESKKL